MITSTDLDVPTAYGSHAAQLPPPRLDRRDFDRLAHAAATAHSRYPGPVGAWLARELTSWATLGYQFKADGLMGRVVTELLGE